MKPFFLVKRSILWAMATNGNRGHELSDAILSRFPIKVGIMVPGDWFRDGVKFCSSQVGSPEHPWAVIFSGLLVLTLYSEPISDPAISVAQSDLWSPVFFSDIHLFLDMLVKKRPHIFNSSQLQLQLHFTSCSCPSDLSPLAPGLDHRKPSMAMNPVRRRGTRAGPPFFWTLLENRDLE